MQAASDVFLGHMVGVRGRHFYVRQLRDVKVRPMVEIFTPANMRGFARNCAWALARAHARSGDPAIISGYIGERHRVRGCHRPVLHGLRRAERPRSRPTGRGRARWHGRGDVPGLTGACHLVVARGRRADQIRWGWWRAPRCRARPSGVSRHPLTVRMLREMGPMRAMPKLAEGSERCRWTDVPSRRPRAHPAARCGPGRPVCPGAGR